MSWSIEFIPFVPWPVLWALAASASCCSRSSSGARAAARCFARLTYALLLLAIANPQLKQEDREPLNDVLAVVVDDSQSQTIAGRDARTEAIRKDSGGAGSRPSPISTCARSIRPRPLATATATAPCCSPTSPNPWPTCRRTGSPA